MAMPPDDYPLPAHPDVPTALVYAAEDELFEPAFQRFMAEELLGIQPIEVKTGHFPMVEDPVTVAELLDRLAGDLTCAEKATDGIRAHDLPLEPFARATRVAPERIPLDYR